jgi:aspartokinase
VALVYGENVSTEDIVSMLSSMGEALANAPLDEFIESMQVDAKHVNSRVAIVKRLAQSAKLLQETYSELVTDVEKSRVFH